MISQVFINLPVENLEKSITFFTSLGFKFNPQFTDENATCMILNEHSFVMLLKKQYFQTFTEKTVCDAKTTVQTLIALHLENKAAVDEMSEKAHLLGGKIFDAKDYGFMYQRPFEDLDGHVWEIFFMDEAAFAAQQTAQ